MGDRSTTPGISVLLFGGAVLVAVLVLAFGFFSLTELDRKVRAAAEDEGRALLGAVAAGVERVLESSAIIENLQGRRLLGLARQLARDVSRMPGREQQVLDGATRGPRPLKGAVLTDATFEIVATARSLRPVQHLEPVVARQLVRRAQALGLGEREEVTSGFDDSPFGPRTEYFVGTRVPGAGGYLIIREDAQEIAAARDDLGVARLLRDAAASPAIVWLSLVTEDGRVVAATERPDVPVIEVELPTRFRGEPAGRLRVGLSRQPVEAVMRRGRASVWTFTGIALALGIGSAIALGLLDRARRRKERAAELGRLAAGVAHEVRSPLNAIGMAAQRLEREARGEAPDAERIREIAGAARREVGRLNATIEGFLDLGRTRPLALSDVDLGELVREAVAAEHPETRLESAPGPVSLRADREELRKAVANLLRNARQAAGDAAVVAAWRRENGAAVVEVRDGGPGIPAGDRQRIFTHFVTGRPGGTGIGLAVVKAVAERHGGTVRAGEAPEGGAMFTIRIPEAPGER